MHISRPAPHTVSVLLVLIGLSLAGAGVYFAVRPSSPFMSVLSANRQGSLSAGESAEFLTAMSRSRPWDDNLAAAARNARQEANRDASIRVLITALLGGGGLALGIWGGRRIAAGRNMSAAPPKITP